MTQRRDELCIDGWGARWSIIMKRTLVLATFILSLGTQAALAQATPPLNPPPTVGRSLNDGGTTGMAPAAPRANRNTGSAGLTTTGSGNDNLLYSEPRRTKRMHHK